MLPQTTNAAVLDPIEPGAPIRPLGTPTTLDSLLDALVSERRLVEELAAIMRRQREAVAADDLQAVDDSVYATHRVLLTLEQAQQRRHSLHALLGNPSESGLGGLDALLGTRMTPPLRDARDALGEAAQTLSREVETNRLVLREVLAAGNEYVRALCGAPEPKLLYAGDARRPEAGGRGGALLNRRA